MVDLTPINQCVTCICGTQFTSLVGKGQIKQYCSDRCRQRAKRARDKETLSRDNHNKDVTPVIKPILKYPGAKWSRAKWITSYFPQHKLYIEPYCGSAAVFLNKAPAEHEILNDLSSNIVNLFRMIRTRSEELIELIELTPWAREEYNASYEPCEDELEQTRRFLVRCWQAHGTRLNSKTGWRHRGPASSGSTTSLWKQLPDRLRATVERFRDAEIEQMPALDLIRAYPDACLYVDPPYVLATRSGALYEHEMDTVAHVELLEVLNQHRGPVLLSGYAHPLYDNCLKHWQRVGSSSLAENGQVRTEVLWLNEKAQHRQLSLFDNHYEENSHIDIDVPNMEEAV